MCLQFGDEKNLSRMSVKLHVLNLYGAYMVIGCISLRRFYRLYKL